MAKLTIATQPEYNLTLNQKELIVLTALLGTVTANFKQSAGRITYDMYNKIMDTGLVQYNPNLWDVVRATDLPEDHALLRD